MSSPADILQEYGFTRDGAGFRAMLAVAKSVSGGEHAAEMEEAVTSWMHGGLGRFELVAVRATSQSKAVPRRRLSAEEKLPI